MSISRNDDSGIKTIFTYNLQLGAYDSIISILNWNKPGAYLLEPNSLFTWGGKDQTGGYCACTMQYLRFFVNYAPETQDQMVNLALMNPQSNFNYEISFINFSF
mgnify:FL=1